MINEIIHGDCLEVMQEIEAGSVDGVELGKVTLYCQASGGGHRNTVFVRQGNWSACKTVVKEGDPWRSGEGQKLSLITG